MLIVDQHRARPRKVIDQRFGPSTLAFSYRIGEVLRRCLEVDALRHVLALRWLTQCFDGYGLVGAHPGIEFHQDSRVVAEVDVVLLFADGLLVPVEVKRTAAGVSAAAVEQLGATSDALGAPSDVICVIDSSPLSDELLLRRRLLERPRFLLSMENLIDPLPAWAALGADPFEAVQGAETPGSQ